MMEYTVDWVTNTFDSGETLKFIFFWGNSGNASERVGKFVLSQWYASSFTVDHVTYKTAEHWMMAHKASLFENSEIFKRILEATKPGEVKELGRQIKNFDEEVWDEVKFEIVKAGNIHKFNQNPELLAYLLNTHDRVLVEASPTDTVWGIGLAQDSKMVENPHTWRGKNLLGFALMEARKFLHDFGSFEYRTFEVVPPWKKYPAVESSDMFWRMGGGEQYVIDFAAYWNSLSANDKMLYALSYPAPLDWREYYK
jgi:ribA/ribD-fused uncharacterized protein